MTDTKYFKTVGTPRETRRGLLAIGLLVLGTILFVCAFSSCAGTTARENVLFPAVKLAWTGVKADVDRGLSVTQMTEGAALSFSLAETKLDTAIQGDDRTKVSVDDWNLLQPFAWQGVDDRLAKNEVGPNVAESLRERIVQFNRSIRALNP